ncbi:MAG: aryl-sulfate sulfotransferase [Candidatus Hodarchaeales archaeon]
MVTIFSLNQDFHWSYSHIVIIILLILSSCQSGSFLVNSIHNTDIIQFQNNKVLSNNSKTDAISKRTTEVKQPEQKPFVNHLGEAFEGYNLFQFRDLDNPPPNFLITDMKGEAIEEFQIEKIDGYGHPINSTTFLLAFDNSTYLWNRETGRNQLFNFSSHHDISYNPTTKTFMTLEIYTIINPYVTIPGHPLIDSYAFDFDTIREMNMDGNVIWELNTSSFVPCNWWTGELTTTGNMDVTHSNSIFWDIEEDMIYLNCRNLNTFFKIDHRTGEVLWGLGEHGDFALFDHYGNQRLNLFYHSHGLKKVDNNTFILFDNDFLNKTDANNHRSRLVEITINETTMTANISWVWTGPSEYYSAYWGDVDRLPNGNRFGTFGTQTHPRTDIGPRLVEVNEAGEIVWEMYYKGGKYSIYRAERFRLNPILSTPEDKLIAIGGPITISWQTWYNFRTKLKMKGSYELYQDGNEIHEGEVVFDKFWRPTNLTFDLDSLNQGKYIFTLMITDEGGHTTEDTVVVYVGISPSEETSNSVTIPTIVSLLLGLGMMTITRGKKKKI